MKIQIKSNVNGNLKNPGFRVICTDVKTPIETWVDGCWPRDVGKAVEEAVRLSGKVGKEAFHVDTHLRRQLKRTEYAEIYLPERTTP